MKQIEKIYNNDIGMAFYWRKEDRLLTNRVQLVFKETGFYFSVSEMEVFVKLIKDSAIRNACCKNCEMKNQCEKFLLKTPCNQIDLAVSMNELKSIRDLVEGTLFRIDLNYYISGIGRN